MYPNGLTILVKPNNKNEHNAKPPDFVEKLPPIPTILSIHQLLLISKIKDLWNFFNQRIKRKNSILIFLDNFYYLFNLHLLNYYASIHLN